jgi:hypothetical protein
MWLRRTVGVTALAVAAAGTWAGFNWTNLKVKYAAHRLQTAATDEDRAQWADTLAANGKAGLPSLLELVRTGEPPARAAAVAALDRHLNGLPDGDPRASQLCGQVLDAFGGCDDAGRAAVLELLPTVLNRGGSGQAARCRDVVASGLNLPSVDSRLVAVRAAMHPDLRMRADLLPLLNAPEPELRRAVLFAVGPASDGEPVVGDEALFRWLHDPDAGVRTICRDALISRGRTDAEIALGRRLAHPDATERLKLLMDLRHDDDVADPEPWLERLSRDPDPGVRAGSARVMVELSAERRLPAPAWVGRVAEADPDPTVRRIARYYRSADASVRPAGGP